MPTVGQIVPSHDFAHVMLQVNDNSARKSRTTETAPVTYANLLFAFVSPKGIDREMHTVATGGDEFVDTYGLGPVSIYGQAFLNAYAAASTNLATLHCLRVTADDATYSMGALVAHYRVTGGSSPVIPDEPDVPTESVIDVGEHTDITAVDSTDDSGVVTITLSGTNVVPGVSNKELFGDVAGNYVDVVLDLSTLDESKNYTVKQVNPALALYMGKDEYIKLVNGSYIKTKSYSGADLKDGYSFLVGGDSDISITITEENKASNGTDLGILVNDDAALFDVAYTTSEGYKITRRGEVAAGRLNPSLFEGFTGKAAELVLTFPGLDPAKQYQVTQINPVLSAWPGDAFISKDENDVWTKQRVYNGSDLVDGYSLLATDANDPITVTVCEKDTTEPICVITVDGTWTFVTAHTPSDESVNYKIASKIVFAGEAVPASYMAKARIAANRAVATAAEPVITEPGTLEVYYTFEKPDPAPTDIKDNIDSFITVDPTPDADGFTAVKLFDVACRGRGVWGNNIRIRLANYSRGDRLSNYKNYTLEVYEIENATMNKREEFTVSFHRNAVDVNGNTLFADFIVGDPYNSSNYVNLVVNENGFAELYAAYNKLYPDTTLTVETFDPILGFVKGSSSRMIEGLTIDTTRSGAISINGASGVSLKGGSDGAFGENVADREKAINEALLKAYTGEIDRNIRSKKLYPTDLILDAGFPLEIKLAIADLAKSRNDCVAILDAGTAFTTIEALREELADMEVYVNDRSQAVDAYYGKIKDPVTSQLIKVTSTYALAMAYPEHFAAQGGKHVALAGSSYAVVDAFIAGSAYPVFDTELDGQILDELTENHVNFLKINSLRQVVRGAQDTRQTIDTNLSELSNVFVLNDIARDCCMLCERYEYNFSEATDLQRFNKAADTLVSKYADAQVKSITGRFDQNDWESERGILHLYVEMVHKNIIKTAIVEIDVNRDDS